MADYFSSSSSPCSCMQRRWDDSSNNTMQEWWMHTALHCTSNACKANLFFLCVFLFVSQQKRQIPTDVALFYLHAISKPIWMNSIIWTSIWIYNLSISKHTRASASKNLNVIWTTMINNKMVTGAIEKYRVALFLWDDCLEFVCVYVMKCTLLLTCCMLYVRVCNKDSITVFCFLFFFSV